MKGKLRMPRRRRRSSGSSNLRVDRYAPEPIPRRGQIITVSVPLPRSVASQARREIYTYPVPSQRQRRTRSIRVQLYRRPRQLPPLVRTAVRIRLPRTLPLVRGSYVSLDRRNRVVIHSQKQHERLMTHELNRRRYNEHKSNHRKARNGQLDSIRSSDPYGSLSRVVTSGGSMRRVSDTVLGLRAIGVM